MPKIAKELRALEVSRLSKPGNHAVGGAAGLYLYVTPSGARSWVLRFNIHGKRRHMGLGAYPAVTLAQARDKARLNRELISQGIDPIVQRQQEQKKQQAEQAKMHTFADAAHAYIEAHRDSWKNPKHQAQWPSTLSTYAFPVIGELNVSDVEQEHVLAILEPFWKT